MNDEPRKGRPPRELGLWGKGENDKFLEVMNEWMTERNRWHAMRSAQKPGLNDKRGEVDRLRKELKDMLDLADGVRVD